MTHQSGGSESRGPSGPSVLGHDYGLVKITMEFSAKRNTTKHPTLNPDTFEPGNAMCRVGYICIVVSRLDMCFKGS